MGHREDMQTWNRFSSGLLAPITNLLNEKLKAIDSEYLEVKEACMKLAPASGTVGRSRARRATQATEPSRLNRGVLKRPSSGELQPPSPCNENKRDYDRVDVVQMEAELDRHVDRTECDNSYKTAIEGDLSDAQISMSTPMIEEVSRVNPLPEDFPENTTSVKEAVRTIETKKMSKWDCLAAGLSVSVLYNKNQQSHPRGASSNRRAPILRGLRPAVSHSARVARPFKRLPSDRSLLGNTRFKVFPNKENVAKTAPRQIQAQSLLKPLKVCCPKVEPKDGDLPTTPVKRNYIITNNELTPPKRRGVMKNENDYGIDELNSEDSTDDEECPRKPRPLWACGEKLLEQAKRMPPYAEAFKTFPAVNLAEIFSDNALTARSRTSSANWHSFHRTLVEEQSVIEDG